MKAKKKQKVLQAALVGIAALGIHGAAFAGDACYGVASAGLNDCGTSGYYTSNVHGCHGQAANSCDLAEWAEVEAGTCESLVCVDQDGVEQRGSLAPRTSQYTPPAE